MTIKKTLSIDQVYDASQFRKAGHELVDFLADQLELMTSGNQPKVLDWLAPEDAISEVDDWIHSDDFMSKVFERCIHLHNPMYMGHQIMPPAPISSLAGFFSDFVNNGMGVYEMGIAGCAMDQWIVKNVGQRMGFDENCGGVMTCGGSLANLTAMLAARANKVPGSWNGSANCENSTETSADRLALMVSDQSHYCVDRAAKIMGWGEAGVIKIPSDDQFRMRTDCLEEELRKAKCSSRRVIAIVGSACSTSTGSYDDLRKIGEFARQHDLWFHVDGAHGGAAIFSDKYKSLVDGIEIADSITLDFHKMLMTPAVTSALLFRDGQTAYQSFAQKADYLWSQEAGDEWFNMAKRTFECTKTMMSLKVCSIIAEHGWDIFGQAVTRLNDLGQELARQVNEAPDFELAMNPQTNIVCFRFISLKSEPTSRELNDLNSAIRKSLIADGEFYIVQTSLNGNVWLRTTIGNPLTTHEHFELLLDKIRELEQIRSYSS